MYIFKYVATVLASFILLSLHSCAPIQGEIEESTDEVTTEIESEIQNDISSLVFDKYKYTFKGKKEDISFNNSVITVKNGGIYELSGNLENGCIIIDIGDDKDITLLFKGLEIKSQNFCPIFIKSAKKAEIILEKGSTNRFSDGEIYNFENSLLTAPNACIYSIPPLEISGDGHLEINGNFNGGIFCRSLLLMHCGSFKSVSKNCALRSVQGIVISSGNFDINSKIGLKCDSFFDGEGFISISGGNFNFECSSCAIDSSVLIDITGGNGIINAPTPYICRYLDSNGNTVNGKISVLSENWIKFS